MSTFFLRKNIICWIASVISTVFVCGVFIYTFILSQTKIVDVNVWFYFLVSEDTRVEAGAEFIKLDGGAGYLLRNNGKDYVVLSVYLEENDGEMVREALAKQGKATRVLSVGIQRLYLKLSKDKKKANIYARAFHCLQSYMKVLTEAASNLEKGGTQEACKRMIQPLIRQLLFLSEQYQELYPAFAKLCRGTADSLAQISNETVYVKDLRYLLCEWAEKTVILATKFSL